METITNIIGGGMVTLLLAVAMPNIIHQACSDDGDFNSGATPECPVWVEAVENSLPPTMEMEVER